MSRVIAPGATLGVLGSGQLGRMFAVAARRLGYRVHVLSPDDDTPTGQVADLEINASYDDLDAVARFAQGVSVVTFEFENVPAGATEAAARFAPVRPAGAVLHATQNRLREKRFLSSIGVPTTAFEAVHTEAELASAIGRLGLPAVLKTADWGYDGKGQRMLRQAGEAQAAWNSLSTSEAILEAFVDYECELSVIGARGMVGQVELYGPLHNDHRDHILDVTFAPFAMPEKLAREALEIGRTILTRLEVVGVLCIEMFLTRRGELLVNELAPRPHNSGHLTIDAHVTCQFEQQVRAVCGLPLGSTRQLSPAAMANLLGDEWSDGEPRWDLACRQPEVKLHLYGKREPRPGRKMGHLTALAGSAEAAVEMAIAARQALRPSR